MKARVKATGEIVEVIAISDYINEFGVVIGEYKDANGLLYTSYDLDFYIEEGITIPDYWTRLKHQYAGMAMQGMVERGYKAYIEHCDNYGDMEVDDAKALFKDHADVLADICVGFAHALVEKLKESKV